MRRVATLYRTTVGKKVLMAVSGVVLFGFVFAHMVGNLKMLFPPTDGHYAMDVYAEFLREVGYPIVPHEGVLWLARVALLAAVGVHVWAALQLSRLSRAARPRGYVKEESLSLTYASRTMRWGGVILLLFVIYHILHFTTGQAYGEGFVAGAVHENYVRAFQSPLIFGVYFLAQAALCLHLYHGVWSFFQTLGLSHPKYNHLRRPFSVAFAVVVFVGFLTPPTLVLAGVIS